MFAILAHVWAPARQSLDNFCGQRGAAFCIAALSAAVRLPGADLHADLALHQGLQRAGVDHFAVFDKGHPVAGDFDFTQQVRI